MHVFVIDFFVVSVLNSGLLHLGHNTSFFTYSSIKFSDHNKNDYYSVCSLVDSLIFSILSQNDLFILRYVWDNMDELDEDWDFESFISDDID